MMNDVSPGGEMMWMVADGVLKASILLLLAGGAARLLRRGPAAARHGAWLLGLIGVLLLPVAGGLMPDWRVPLPGWAGASPAPVVAAAVRPEVDGRTGVSAPSLPGLAPLAPGDTHGRHLPAVSGHEARLDAVGVHATTGPVAAVPGEANGTALATVPETVGPTDSSVGSFLDEAVGFAIPWAALVLGIWFAGALILLLRLLAHRRALHRLEAWTPVLPDLGVQELAASLAARLGIRRQVRILEGPADAMPSSWGAVHPTILLPAGAEGWSRRRLSAVLLHELAHVRRWDCLTQLLAELVVALHWFNPLAWLAAHRLRVEREHACDDIVLRCGAAPTTYASELVGLARDFRTLRGAAVAGIAMSGPAHLRERVVALLDPRRPRRLGGRVAFTGIVLAGVTVLGLASVTPARAGAPDEVPTPDADWAPAVAPVDGRGLSPIRLAGVQEVTCGMAQDGWRSTSVQSRNDEEIDMEWSRPGCTVEIEIDGDIDFTDDFRDIARISSGGRFRIEEDDDGTERWLEITPGSGGRLEYEYRVDRDDRPFDSSARAWYEAMLLQAFRRSGIAAEERVAALLRTGGEDAVLQEIDELHSDHVFARYVEEFIRQADLTENEAVRLVEQAEERVDSDHYMAQILLALADRHLTSDQGVDAFLRATRTLESDHYKAEVLGHALDNRELERDQVLSLIRAVNGMESDHYTAEVLGEVAGRYFLDAEMREPYLDAVMTVESDHYKAQLLQNLLDRGDLSAQETDVVLDAVAQMESDHYKAEILKEFGRDLPEAQLGAYIELAGSMTSDHYRSEILLEVASRDLSDAQMVQTIEAVEIMDSDHYKAAVLEQIIRHRPARDGAVYDALVEAMDSIESRHYRGEIAEMLLPR